MTRALLLAPFLILAACRANDPLPVPTSAAEVACRNEGQAAPGVKSAFERLSDQNMTQRNRVMAEAAAAEKAAYQRCMRGKGLAPPGGVEAVRPIQ
jgi:hypothetical protein